MVNKVVPYGSRKNFVGPKINPALLKFRLGKKFHLDVIPKRKTDKLLIEWAKQVKQRDGMMCIKCGSVDKLHSHHVQHKSEYPELKYDVDNGITLRANCHADVHGGLIAKALRGFWK